MESAISLQELAKREAKKDRDERLARVKALTDEGMRMKQQPQVAKRARGGRVKKSYFSSY